MHAVMPERGFWPMLSPGNMQTICRYTASQKYTVDRAWR
ncbi:Mobile element protein [Escherichia coli CE418]|nr:Mobile element protein [Escherichia coli CE418]